MSSNRPKSDASGHSCTHSTGQTTRSSQVHLRHNAQSSITSVDDGSLQRNTQSLVGSSRRKELGSYDAVIHNGEEASVANFSFPSQLVSAPHLVSFIPCPDMSLCQQSPACWSGLGDPRRCTITLTDCLELTFCSSTSGAALDGRQTWLDCDNGGATEVPPARNIWLTRILAIVR